MSVKGWIAIHREMLEHHLFKGHPDRFYAWAWLLANAAWKETRHDVNGRSITVGRGQLCVSLTQLSEAFGWSKSATNRFLTRLKTETMIETESGTGKNIITICNYSKYQDVLSESGTATGTASETRAERGRNAKEQSNHLTSNSSEEEYRKKPAKRSPEKPAQVDIPDWIEVEAWNGFVESRKKLKKPLTERAAQLALKKLEAMWVKGICPNTSLNNSALNGWTDVYEPKGDGSGQRNYNQANRSGGDTFGALVAGLAASAGEQGSANGSRVYDPDEIIF